MDQKVINSIRFLSVDAVQKANSGHPGLPMGTATMAYALWANHLNASGKNTEWPDRDRFVLSAGHGSMLQYSLLHLFGYDVSMEDLKNFRQWGSKTPGHPEYGHTPGVETTTGPLGQGIANAVGMAMAERRLAAEFNTEDMEIVDHHTYSIVGDGDLMEGVASEACSLAGHQKLGKLIVLYDDNKITIDGTTEITFTEDVGKRFEAYGWEVIKLDDSEGVQDITDAIEKAKQNIDKPSLIMVPTTIGFGSPNKAGKSAAHGAPLGDDEIRLTREGMKWEHEPFFVPEDVYTHMEKIVDQKDKKRKEWEKKFEEYRTKYPELAQKWDRWHSMELPEGLMEDEELFSFDSKVATRAASGKVINTLAKHMDNLFGGSADLAGSNKTTMKDKGDFQADTPDGNNINFGVREHGMGAVLNGISLHGGLRGFGATFLIFANYMRPAIRMSALMNQPVVYVLTHDSIALGEDGPTHQPIEQLAALRAMPNVKVFRPADAKETAVAWIEALNNIDGPSVLALTRQGLPTLDNVEGAHQGGYVIDKEEGETPDVILIGTGSEVSLLIDAKKELKKDNIDARVVSILSWELFDQQDDNYKKSVLPPHITKRVSAEAGSTFGWQKYIGSEGKAIGIDTFGASAPGPELMEKFGFNVENVVKTVKEIM
ncbi:transketolase [Clostridium sp. D2Q-11]|uniref:Transketolase n=1 Tax=Anaeromonas frigoriresistens TaxID=2683708 RepID=A0A942Z5W7_9FIRM|nr:transketolase [Anaeromonas frigoriresistens]MBS4537876.1 transketolase [Anaeromonas frigoriresistens]